MSDNQQNLFRKKTLDRISSPEQLTDYLRVTNPGIWIILAAVILLLAGLCAWSVVGTLDTEKDVKVVVEQHTAAVISPESVNIEQGMPLHVSGKDYVINSSETDEYGRSIGRAAVDLPDGVYDGTVVTETVHAVDFLLESR